MRFKRRPPFRGPPLRRPGRRPLVPSRRPIPGVRLQPQQPVPPMLVEANRLFSQGKYLQAAGLYETLAHRAVDQHRPRAPYLFLLAGRANLMGGKNQEGVNYLKECLQLLAAAGRWYDLDRIGARVVDELEERGFQAEASEVATFLESLRSGMEMSGKSYAASPASRSPHARPSLPTNCSACGASIHPQEVEWVDKHTAACSYCGNMVRAED